MGKQDNEEDIADVPRDDPDGESDGEDIFLKIPNNRDRLVSCSTFNSVVEDSMVDIVKTAKEARAMIRGLSCGDEEDVEGGVKFVMGWDEETEDDLNVVDNSN